MSRSFSFRKGHRYDDIAELRSDLTKIDSKNNPTEILDIDHNNFGLYNIDRIKAAIEENKLRSLTVWEKYMLKRLFEIKEQEKKGDMKGAAEIKQTAIKVYEDDKKANETAAKITSAVGKATHLELSKETTAKVTKVIDAILKSDSTSLAESPKELSLEERFARLKDPNAKGSKSKKRRGTRKRRGTKRRGTKRRRNKRRGTKRK